jgi:nucleoside-diphosphate-sugar epimerase
MVTPADITENVVRRGYRAAMRRVVVVGGTSGIGLAVATDLGRDHQVTVVGRDPARLAQALNAIGAGATGERVDAGDRSGLDRFFARYTLVGNLVVAVPTAAEDRSPNSTLPTSRPRCGTSRLPTWPSCRRRCQH